MATDFPDTSINNPNTGVGWANGDAFDDTANSGLIYYWYDPVWKTSLSSADADAKYVEVDGDTMTGDLTVPSLNSGPLAGFRNQIINGDFRIFQRGQTGSTTSGYTADRWLIYARTPGQIVQYDCDNFNIPGTDSDYYLRLRSAAGENSFTFEHRIELPGSPTVSQGPFVEGSTWTLSFWMYSLFDSRNVIPQLMLSNSNATASSNVVSFDLHNPTNSWQKYEATVTLPAWTGIPADATCMRLRFSGLDNNQQQDIYITQVQLEPGPVATPFEHRPIGTELALCQRYYVDDLQSEYGAQPRATGNVGVLNYFFPVEMRATPTCTTTAGTAYNAYTKGVFVFSTGDSWSATVTADAEL